MIDLNFEFSKLEVFFTDLKLTEFLLGINNSVKYFIPCIFIVCTWYRLKSKC